MDKRKWTPGPWVVDQVVSDSETDIIAGYEIPGAGNPVLIASTYGGEDDDDDPIGLRDARANALLIAKSPAMAEAIRDQVAWIERLLQGLTHHDVADARGNVVNGFAGAVVPDWELRQKLDGLKHTMDWSDA